MNIKGDFEENVIEEIEALSKVVVCIEWSTGKMIV